MSASESFASDILQKEYDLRRQEFDRLTDEVSKLRNRMSICTSKPLYSVLKGDIDRLDKLRRDLRGEMSALRQAIAKLQKED